MGDALKDQLKLLQDVLANERSLGKSKQVSLLIGQMRSACTKLVR